MALHDHAIQMSDRGMRVIRFPLVLLIIAFAVYGLGSAIAAVLEFGVELIFSKDVWDTWAETTFRTLLQCGFALLGYWIFVSLFDGRETTELTKGIVRYNVIGIALGAGFISLIVGIMALFGFYRIDGLTENPAILSIMGMAVFAGIVEEILLRGYFFRIIEESLGTWISVALSALLFGFLHIWNPNASVLSSVSIALTAGVVLALLFVLTRSLWIVIGMHFAWNFTLGGIWSAPVSGGDARGLFNGVFEGPEIMTGGDFGPEASIITMLVFLAFGIYLGFRTIKEDKVVKPFWRRRND